MINQNYVYRGFDVSALAYIEGFFCICLGVFLNDPFNYLMAAIAFGTSAVGFIYCFKYKYQLKKKGQWVNLSFRENMDFHWWRKGAVD